MRTLPLIISMMLVILSHSAWAQPAPPDPAPVPTPEGTTTGTAAPGDPATEPAVEEEAGPHADLKKVLELMKQDRAQLQPGSEAEQKLLALAGGTNPLVEARYDLGVFYLRLNALDKAAQYFQDTLGQDANYSEAVGQLGVIEAKRGEPDKARALFDQALAMDKYCSPARNYLSRVALEEGKPDEAIKHCRIALLGDPDNLNAYLNMAIAWFRKGQLDVGELVCQSALRIDDNNAPILNMLGLIHLKRDDVRGAITMFQMAVDADPLYLDARKNLAAVTLNFKDFETAAKQLAEVLKQSPNDDEFRISYAVALRGMQQYDEARQALNQVLTKSRGNQDARYNLCILLHEYVNDYGEALTVCSEFDASIDKRHPKAKEMKLRIKGIRETIQAMEEMRKLEETTPPEKPEDGGQPTEDGGQPTEDGGQPTEDGGQPTEDGGQPTAEGGKAEEKREETKPED